MVDALEDLMVERTVDADGRHGKALRHFAVLKGRLVADRRGDFRDRDCLGLANLRLVKTLLSQGLARRHMRVWCGDLLPEDDGF